MRVAVVTDDGQKVSAHFGRARYYLVCTIEAGEVTGKELRDKAGHHGFGRSHGPHEHGHGGGHGMGRHSAEKHSRMIEPLNDCEALIAGGMGRGAHQAVSQADVKPIITDIPSVDEALREFVNGTIIDHPERLH